MRKDDVTSVKVPIRSPNFLMMYYLNIDSTLTSIPGLSVHELTPQLYNDNCLYVRAEGGEIYRGERPGWERTITDQISLSLLLSVKGALTSRAHQVAIDDQKRKDSVAKQNPQITSSEEHVSAGERLVQMD